jgi:hypothetical protein
MSTTENFFQRAWAWVTGEFTAAEDAAKKIADFANKLVDEIKGLEANPTVQAIGSAAISIAEGIDPALTPLINGLELELPKIFTAIGNVDTEVNKTEDEQLKDFLAYLGTIKGLPTIYAGQLATLSAAIQAFLANNSGVANTPAQLITASQVVHASVV